jgi:hypothetical protein
VKLQNLASFIFDAPRSIWGRAVWRPGSPGLGSEAFGTIDVVTLSSSDAFPYPDSVRFLYALGNEYKTIKLGLERIQTLLSALGDPHCA